MPRNEKGTRARGWIRSKTRIGPVLNIKVCYRDEQYCVEVQIRIVNGVDTYVTESMLTKKEKDIASGKAHC